MQATRIDAPAPETHEGDGRWDAAWGVGGVMAEAILPNGPAERRKRRRMCALRAMDRLGLLGEENMIPTLARRPELRWLADEKGARWDVLAQLGRIGEPETFEAAVAWALENRPRAPQTRAHVWRLRAGAALAREATEAHEGRRHLRPTRNHSQEKER